MSKDKTINIMNMRITYVMKSKGAGSTRQYSNRSKILVCKYIDKAEDGKKLLRMTEIAAALLISKSSVSRWRKDYYEKLIPDDFGYVINRRPEVHTTIQNEISELRRQLAKKKYDISMIVKTAETKVKKAEHDISIINKEMEFLEMAASRGYSQTNITINQ